MKSIFRLFLIVLFASLGLSLAFCGGDKASGDKCETSADCSDPTPVCDPDSGTCVGCLADTDCDDGEDCTADSCADSECSHQAAADGTTCDDGNGCTSGDACTAGVCGGTLEDADGDGFGPESCGGDDCDDADADVKP